MTAETLLDNIGAIAAGLGGIDRIRKLILELAVRGVMVPQEPGEVVTLIDPSPVIQKGKKKQNNTGLQTPIDSANHSAIVNIPESWRVVEFERVLAEIKPGFAAGQRDPKGIVQLRMNNVNTIGGFNWNKMIRIPIEGVKNIEDYYLFQGDILFNNTNSSELVGKSAVFDSFPEPIVFSNHFTRLRPKTEAVSSRYIGLWLNYLWNSRVFSNLCNKWIGQSAVNKDKLGKLAFPLPPLSEQHRIVEKVDRLMALCDELERRQQAEREERRRLRTTSLAALEEAATAEEAERAWARVAGEFGRLVDTVEDVGELRKIILKTAVKGRLTQRLRTDGTADDLIQRIISEKENDKNRTRGESRSRETTRTNETIPSSWAMARFGEISFCRDEERIPVSKDERNTREKIYDYYGASGVIDKIDDYLFDKPLLLIGEDGANLINRSTPIAFIAEGKYWVNNHAHVIDGLSLTMLQYLALYINSIDLKPYVTGTAQPKLNQAKLNSIPVNVPPLDEQHRIVEKVDSLMALCDTLEAGIRARDAALEAFAGVACRAVFDGPAPVAAPAAVAVRATGQQRLPV